MAPEIRDMVRSNEGEFGLTFCVDLKNRMKFDPNEFDNHARHVVMDGSSSYLKFVVFDDTMYVFDAEHGHADFFESLGVSDKKLQCAGFVAVFTGGGKEDRVISGYSTSLKLPIEKSEKYKLGTLTEALGEYFTIRTLND